MNYKKVLEFMKEHTFGFDRKKVCDSEPDPRLPDAYDQETTCVDHDEDGNVVEFQTWIPPKRSTATRAYPERTKGSGRGALVDPRTERSVTFASTIEMKCALFLIASPYVQEVYDQPPAIKYTDARGRRRSHTPDYLAVGPEGRCAIAVKPHNKVKKSGIEDIIKRIKPNLGRYADDFILLTDLELTESRANNSESALNAHENRIQEHCDRVLDIVRDIDGEVNAYHIAGAFGDFDTGMNAVWCLVFDGLIELADPSRMLSDNPYIVRTRQGGHSAFPLLVA